MVAERFSVAREDDAFLAVPPADSASGQKDLQGLFVADEAGLQVCAELRSASAAALSMESISRYLSGTAQASELGQTGVQFANIAIESICLQAQLPAGAGAFSLGVYRRDPALALEGALDFISAKLSDLWKLIKEKLVLFFRYLAEKMDFFKRSLGNLKRRTAALEAQAAGLDSTIGPQQSSLYPQQCFADLMYLASGFPPSAKGVAPAVDQALLAHANVFSAVIAKHSAWLKDNQARVRAEPDVINEFSVKTSDFLMLEARPLSRSIRKHAPREGSVFYRSKELPGGRAVYTEIEPKDQTGLAAIEMLTNVNVYLDKFDPISYDLRALELAKQAQAQMNAWYWAQPVSQRKGSAPPRVDTSSAKVAGTGNTPRLTPGVVFDTLSLALAKERLAEVSNSAAVLEKWYDSVFGQLWKDKDFDALTTALLKDPGLDGDGAQLKTDPAPRYLGNLVLALLSVMANATANTHTYALTTYDSLLSYVEESLFQYTFALKGA